MANINTAPSQVATSALESLPFETIIGAPLDACIKAQAHAAQTSANFIQQVGMQDSDGDGVQEAINVSFTFIQNGKMMRLNIPLLSIVPIPYIAIQNVDIAFKANINASASTGDETTTNTEFSTEASGGTNRLGWGLFGIKIDMKGSVSSKRDSRATQDSKYSVEYTMDIGIHAGQDSMPGGLAKVLEIMNNCITLTEPEGTLGVNDHYFVIIENDEDKKHAQLIATYKSPEGLYQPAAIVLHSDSATGTEVKETVISGNSKVYAIDKPGTYVLTAGQLQETIVVKSAGETPAKEVQAPQVSEA